MAITSQSDTQQASGYSPTAFQLHTDLADAHHILAKSPSPITGEGWDLIGRAMAHIRAQMAPLSIVIMWGGQ